MTTLGQVPVGTRPGTRPRGPRAEQVASAWLRGLRVYLGVILVGNLIWEALHVPLYTIWTTGTLWEQAFAVVYCIFGDLLIAASTLTLALILAGDHTWPRRRFWLVASLTIVFGIGYTAFSEWANVGAQFALQRPRSASRSAEGRPAIVPAGIMGDRADVIFASPEEVSSRTG